MPPRGHGRAAGKIILLGEHAVVYGRPALATAIPLGLEATVEDGPGPALCSDAPPDRRGAVLVEAAARAVALDPANLRVRVVSTIPPGRGLGSSAALAVAVFRAAADAAGRVPTMEETIARGCELEAIFHGTPSGIDPAVAALGGTIRFVRGAPPTIEPVRPARVVTLVVAHGPQARSTGAAVGALRARVEADRARHERVFDDVAHTVDEGVAAFVHGDLEALGAAFDRNQALLETLGVSAPEIAERIAVARRAGALGAKLTGGGAGGAVVAVARDADALVVAFSRVGDVAFRVDVGALP